MSVPKYKALLIACITLFLCGCGQALSEREIVRAVFFARQQGQYSVCLLLAAFTTRPPPHAVSPPLRLSTGPRLRCRAAFITA